jgi:hypothetical protein
MSLEPVDVIVTETEIILPIYFENNSGITEQAAEELDKFSRKTKIYYSR